MSFIRRTLPFLFLAWLADVIIRSATASIKTLTNPFNPGDDWVWFLIWFVTVAILLVLYIVFHKQTRLVTSTVLLVFLAAAILFVFLSHTLFPFSSAVWLFLICGSLGCTLLDLFVGDEHLTLDGVLCAIPLGFTALALGAFIIGILGFLTRPVVWVVMLAATALLRHRLRAFIVTFYKALQNLLRSETLSDAGPLIPIIAFAGLVDFIWAIAPEIQFDALNYHLAIPKTYLLQGRILEIEFLHAYFARLIEVFFAIGLALGGPANVKFCVFFASMWAVLVVFGLAKALSGLPAAYWAASLFITAPLVGWLAGSAYVDNVLTLLVASSLLALVRWHRTISGGWLYAAATLAGMAAGSKLNAAFAFVALGPFVLYQVLHAASKDFASRIRHLLSAVGIFLVVAGPTYIFVYVTTGNPVFPLLNGFFRSEKWSLENMAINASYGLTTSFGSLLRFPFRMTFDTVRFGEGLPRGAIGLSLALALPFALFVVRRRGDLFGWLLLSAAAYLVLLFETSQYARFYVLVLPIFAIAAVATAFDLSVGKGGALTRICLLLIVVLQPTVLSVQFWNIPERFPLSVVLGAESREAFLGRALAGYKTASFINTVCAPGDKVLGVETENLRFYLSPTLETIRLSLVSNRIQQLNDMPPSAELAREIKKLGFTRLFTTRSATANPAPSQPYLQQGFLNAHAELEYGDEYTVVYRFK